MLRHLGEPGGIGVYTTNVLETLFALDRDDEYAALYPSPGFLGHFRHFPNVSEHVVRAPSKLLWDQVAVPRFARAQGLDVIYNPKLSVPLFTRCHTVLIIHGVAQFVLPRGWKWWDQLYFTLASRLYCRRATAIIATTHRGARDVATYMRADPGKIRVVNLAYNERCRVLDRAQLGAVKERYSLPDRFILFVGGLEPEKNIGNLFRAYARLRREFPHKLVIASFPRWKYAGDLELLDTLRLRDDVIFTGYLTDDLPAVYNLADLLLFPSLYEAFGMPVLEAMASACPVVTAKTGSLPEVVGDAARLVDPYDVEDIAAAARRVLSEPALREDLVERGLARVRHFSWERCARETLAVFRTLGMPAAAAQPSMTTTAPQSE
jgi:glycosyltransferase involved in cell wall biosynthesis